MLHIIEPFTLHVQKYTNDDVIYLFAYLSLHWLIPVLYKTDSD